MNSQVRFTVYLYIHYDALTTPEVNTEFSYKFFVKILRGDTRVNHNQARVVSEIRGYEENTYVEDDILEKHKDILSSREIQSILLDYRRRDDIDVTHGGLGSYPNDIIITANNTMNEKTVMMIG